MKSYFPSCESPESGREVQFKNEHPRWEVDNSNSRSCEFTILKVEESCGILWIHKFEVVDSQHFFVKCSEFTTRWCEGNPETKLWKRRCMNN